MNKRRCFSSRCNCMPSMWNRYRAARRPYSTALWRVTSWTRSRRDRHRFGRRRCDQFPARSRACLSWRKMSCKVSQFIIKTLTWWEVAGSRPKIQASRECSTWTSRSRKLMSASRVCSCSCSRSRTWTPSSWKAKTSQSFYRQEAREVRNSEGYPKMEASGKSWSCEAI